MINTRRPLQIAVAISIVCLFVLSSTVQSEVTYPVDNNSFIIDDVDILNSSEEEALEQNSKWLFDGWGTEIVVVLINSTANYTTENDTNMSLADYTVKLFDEWKVGDQEWQDGVLIVLAVNQSGSWEWWYEYGLFWESYQWILDAWEDEIPSSVDVDMEGGNWSDALNPMVEQLALEIDEFWYAEDGWVEPPVVEQDWATQPTLNGQSEEGAGAVDWLFSLVCFGGCAVLIGLVVFGVVRGSGSSGVSFGSGQNRGWGRGYNPGYNGGVGYQENNYYVGGFNDTPNQNLPPPSSGGSRPSRKSSSGGSSRGGSRRSSGGGGSRRSGGGGGSRRSGGGGGGRRGGGRRGR